VKQDRDVAHFVLADLQDGYLRLVESAHRTYIEMMRILSA
jgi:hypothetical protein